MAQDGLSDVVGRVVSWLTLALIGVLLFEIVARYFLNSPTIWAHELSTMLYGAFCILAGSYTLRHHGHVRSEVVYGLMPPRLRAFCDLVVYALTLAVLAIFLRFALSFAYESWSTGEYSNMSMWQPPLYPIKATIPLAVALLMLQALAELVRAVLRLFGISYHDPRDEPSY
ncbi:TRAP transporter small permease subunit [uncultured Halomonas sp.]|uniref:TRAP transporter small permease subunit n=1 Tax=uncultured Halomonas sp. TaxID=173971 RepID=UPI002635F156|nr:TRAP transporter small permease subunit [uncultured Halomonas sp.]